MAVKEIITWIIVSVIALLIVSMIINPTIYTNVKNKVINVFSKSENKIKAINDPLLDQCQMSINDCISTSEKKYGFTINIIKTIKVNNLSEGNSFYNQWKSFLQSNLESEYSFEYDRKINDSDFPIVMFALALEKENMQNPLVAICQNNGTLISFSKISLLC